MSNLTSFPCIARLEFETACEQLSTAFGRTDRHKNGDLLSMDRLDHNGTKYMRVTKALLTSDGLKEKLRLSDDEGLEFEEKDNETSQTRSHQVDALVFYDIILSPSYQVPVLYFGIKDPSYRYPPSMENLYRYLIPAPFRLQAENAGVIGGITITDHPFTNLPVFFIHPCQTATVIEASLDPQQATPANYLLVWMGAIASCAGISIPVEVAKELAA